MRGREHQDERLEEFIAARTQDLHHDAYQLTAAQKTAEHLVVTVLADMRREHVDLTRAGADARLRMARAAARHDAPTRSVDVSQPPRRFQVLARLSPRQRAVLLAQVVDNHDERETARALGLSTRSVTDTLRSIPYDELPGASPHSGELRSLLEEFGDLATTPGPTTTLTNVRDAPPPARRPRWTYVAAALVIVLTIASLVITQRWHDDWLRSPEGLNRVHGTHFPAYTQGYRLVDIHEIAPGPAVPFTVIGDAAVAVQCAVDRRTPTFVATLTSQLIGTFQAQCSGRRAGMHLVPARGDTSVAIHDYRRPRWPVAVYRRVPWDQYPVVTTGFVVEHDQTLHGDDPTTSSGSPLQPSSAGHVLTLAGSAAGPNGTFTGHLAIPADVPGTNLVVSGLLSPTTTGRFKLAVAGHTPWTTCGGHDLTYYAGRTNTWCEFVDRRVPQVPFTVFEPPAPSSRTLPVTITVEHARGPWTLQIVADRYKLDNGAVDDAGSAPRN